MSVCEGYTLKHSCETLARVFSLYIPWQELPSDGESPILNRDGFMKTSKTYIIGNTNSWNNSTFKMKTYERQQSCLIGNPNEDFRKASRGSAALTGAIRDGDAVSGSIQHKTVLDDHATEMAACRTDI